LSERILIIAAHPDDEVLGCGGTIARLCKDGHRVTVAILGEGVTSRSVKREEADPKEVENLRRKSLKASKILGAADVRFFGLPDNRFDTLALLDVVKNIEGLLEEFQPVVVYTHYSGDLNVDHQVTFRAVLTATRPIMGGTVTRLLSFEVPSSTEWSFGRIGSQFNPNYFVDVDETLETKIEAMACYEGEVREFPHPRSPEALRVLARNRGAAVGMSAAEAFEVVRWVC
jgi:LmbE family N-acetylglucosaminyl deacetylase